MEARKLVEVDDEVYLAVVTEIGKDSAGEFARAFKLYRDGEEVDLDTLSDMAVAVIHMELDSQLADARGDAKVAEERAEQRARRRSIVNR